MDVNMDVRQITDKLGASAWAFAALCAAAESGMLVLLNEPRTAAQAAKHSGIPLNVTQCMLEVLASLGVVQIDADRFSITPALASMASPPEDASFLAGLRSKYLQSWHFVDSAVRKEISVGWHYTDPVILQSQGFASGAIAQQAMVQLLMSLPGLMPRLMLPSATFLDVGIGVGAISIGACRALANLHVVGLEPQDAPLAEARRNIAAAGLTDRIELRKQFVQDMTDNEAFDMAFFPQMFMPDEVVKLGLKKIWQALRPGGWVNVSVISKGGMELEATVSRLVDTLWGGDGRVPGRVEEMLMEAGFIAVQAYPVPLSATLQSVVGQRPA